MGKSRIFYSKVSKGLLGFTLFLILIPVLLIDKSLEAVGFLLLLIFPVLVFVIHVFLYTHYTITKHGMLEIRSGLYQFKPIDIQSIKFISPTRSLISSPASSLDRLEIKYAKFSSVLVSPKDKSAFIDSLLHVNKNIKVLPGIID